MQQTVIAVLGHDLSGAYNKDEAGHWHACSRCGMAETKAAHTYNTTNCAEKATCTVCGYEKAAGNHSWNAGVVTTAAACETKGVKTFTCTSCSATRTEDIPALGHTEKIVPGVAATCTATGLTDGKTCSVCNTVLAAQKEIPALGHTEVTVPGKAATCTATGLTDGKTCSVCSAVLAAQQEIPALGHKMSDWTKYDADSHSQVCENGCGLASYGSHGFDNDVDATCDICGYTRTVIGPNGFDLDIRREFDKNGIAHLVYQLLVPTGHSGEEYFVTLCDTDFGSAYSTSVLKGDKYTGTLMAAAEWGQYTKVEVADETRTMIAQFYLEKPLTVYAGVGGMIQDLNMTVAINYKESTAAEYAYDVSGLTVPAVYWLETEKDANGNSTLYELGSADASGKASMVTEAQWALTDTVYIYGMQVGETADKFVVDISVPVKLSAPKYDPAGNAAANLADLLKEADDLGLLKYLDANEFTPGAQVTRLQMAKLAAGLMGLDIPANVTTNDPFNDCGDMTNVEKAIVLYLAQDGVITGYADGSFQPANRISNAGIVKILDRALGEPVVAMNNSVPVAKDYHAYWSYAMLGNLGVLNDQVVANVNAAAVIEDVLEVFINGMEWLMDTPVHPTYRAANARFDGTKLVWALANQLPTGLDPDELSFRVTFKGPDGEFTFRTDEEALRLWYAMGGEYDTVVIETYYADRWCGEYETKYKELTLSVDERMGAPATVDFILNGDGTAYRMYIEGLEPGGQFNIFFGEKKGHFGMGIGDQADANGTFEKFYPVDEFAFMAECIENGGYFLLREYPGWSINPTEAKMDIVNRGGWFMCADGSTAGPLSYEVTNIRIEDQYLMWDEPTAAYSERLDYNVMLSANGGQSWIDNCGTNGTDLAVYAFAPNTYNKIRIETWVGNKLMASVDMDIDLFIGEYAAKPAPEMDFQLLKDSDGHKYFELTITGLTPNTSHIVQLRDLPENWNNSNFQEVVSDANGVATIDFWDLELVDFGYWVVTELVDYSQADSTTAKAYKAQLGEPQRFFEPQNKVWFTTYTDGYMDLFWDYELLPNATDYDGVYVQYFNQNDSTWYTWGWEHMGAHRSLVNHPDSEPGTYTKVRVVAYDEEQNANGYWDMVKEDVWFTADIDLTITVDTNAPAVTVTDDGNGEYTFNITDLSGQYGSVFEVINSEEADGMGRWWSTNGSTEGNTTIDLTVDWPNVKNGYYRMREYVDVRSYENTASFTIREIDWEKCFPCGHVTTIDHPVSNIRIEGSRFVWDEPVTPNPDYCYEVSVSNDFGQTWEKISFVEDGETECHFMRLDAGVYQLVQVKTILLEDCCEHEVGSMYTDMHLTVFEDKAATPATVTFVPVDGLDDTYSIIVDGLTPGNWADIGLAFDSQGRDQWGSYGTPSADSNGRAVRDEINSYWPDEFSMEEILTDGYYNLYEFGVQQTDDKVATMTRITHGGWTKSVITSGGSGDDSVTGTATLINDDGYVYMTWKAAEPDDMSNYAQCRVYLHDIYTEEWRLVDVMDVGETEVQIMNSRLQAGSYDQVRFDLTNRNTGKATTWFYADIELAVSQFTGNAAVEFIPLGSGNYTAKISGLSYDYAELVVRNKAFPDEYNDDSFNVNGSEHEVTRYYQFVDNNGEYCVREYKVLETNGKIDRVMIYQAGWNDAVSTGGSGDATGDVWFSENAEGTKLYVNWKPVTLESGKQYILTMTNSTAQLGVTSNKYNFLSRVTGTTETTSFGFTVNQGDWSNKTELYSTAADAVKVTVSGAAPTYTVVGQADGTYKIISDAAGGYFYQVLAPDGGKLTSGYTADGTFKASLFEGCSFKVQTGGWEVGADGKTVNVTLSAIGTVNTFTPCTSSGTTTTVTTFDALEEALLKGGTVKLGGNIQGTPYLDLTYGPAATLDLNGYVLDVPYVYVESGKELTIQGTTAGSGILSSSGENVIYVQSYAKLTVNGGQYEKIDSYQARSITLNHVTAEAAKQTLNLAKTPEIIINGGSFNGTATGDNTGYQTISMNDVGDVVMKDATVTGYYFAVDIYGCDSALLENCTLTGAHDCFRVLEGTATLKNVTATANTAVVLLAQSGGHIIVESGTYKATGSQVMQLSSNPGCSITVNGGTFGFTDNSGSHFLVYADQPELHTLTVNGGTFQGVSTAYHPYGIPGTTIFNGGTFSFDPTSEIDATTHTVTDNGNGTWTISKIGEGGDQPGGDDPVVTDTLTLFQNNSWIGVEWQDYGYSRYGLLVVDQNGNEVYRDWKSDTSESNILHRLPTPAVAGTYTYDLVLYATDGNYTLTDELARLEDAFVITVAGAPVNYGISFNDPAMGEHTVTFGPGNPDTVMVMDKWYNKDGSSNGTGLSTGNLSNMRDKNEYEDVADGMRYDLRGFTAMELVNNSLQITMTPESSTTYVAPPATNTVEFTTDGIGVLRLNWDYEEPAGLENAYYLLMQLSEDGGKTWTMESETYDPTTSTWWLSDSNVVPGEYDTFRVSVAAYGPNGLEVNEWFTTSVDLTITGEPGTAKATFEATDTEGKYSVTYTGLYYNSNSDRGFMNVSYTDDPANGSRSSSGRSINGVTDAETSSKKYIPEGYYRIDVFHTSVANGTTGSVVMQVGEWKKCLSGGGTILPDDEF